MREFSVQENDERLRYLESARQFFLQVWRENPDLIEHGDPRLKEIINPDRVQTQMDSSAHDIESLCKQADQT